MQKDEDIVTCAAVVLSGPRCLSDVLSIKTSITALKQLPKSYEKNIHRVTNIIIIIIIVFWATLIIFSIAS